MAKKLAYYGFCYLFSSLESLKKDVDFKNIKMSEKLVLLTFVAFTYESFLNHAGHCVCKTWDEHLKPKLSPKGKMAFLCEVAKIEPDYSKSPFQTFNKVITLRNDLAHAKTEYLNYDEELHKEPNNWPIPKWQQVVASLDVQKVIKDLEELMNIIEKGLKLTHIPPSLLLMEMVDVPD